MNRLTFHHTGGGYTPSVEDLEAYHGVIDGDAQLHEGRHRIAANAPGQRLRAGRYAAHTKNLNSGNIGRAMAAMHDADWASPFASTRFPIKPAQVDALILDGARLCLQFGIQPDRRFTLSHAEVEITLGVDQDAKWDFDYPPRGGPGARNAVAIGDELRAELVRAIKGLRGQAVAPAPAAAQLPRTLVIGAEGDAVEILQRRLNAHGATLLVDGRFGPATRRAVIAFQRANELLPDGVVGRMTWPALLAD